MTNERKKFHPSVLLVYFIRDLKNWIFLFFLLLVDLNDRSLYSIIGLSVLVALIIIKGIVKYNTQTYEISPEKLTIYRGIFNKKETELTYDRIQTVKQRQWFFFKPFNVVEVLIETASSSPGEAEASLTAVDYSLVELIESYRNKTATKEAIDEEDLGASDIRFHLSNKEIGLYALTDVTVLLVLATLFTFALEWLPGRVFTEIVSYIDYFQGILIFLLVLLGLSIMGVISLLKNFLLFYNYQASLDQDTLTIEYGLFERKVQKIPLNKIQGIRLHKQIIRSLFQRSSVELIIMGGQEKENDGLAVRKIYLFPLIHNDHVYSQLDQFLPNITLLEPEINPVSKNRLWYFWRWILLIGIPLVTTAFFYNRLIGAVLVMILGVVLFIEWNKSRVQGYTIQNKQLLCLQNFQGLSTVQLFISKKNIQAFSQSSTLWLAKKDLGHLKISFKEGETPMSFDLRFISQTDSQTIHQTFWDQTYEA